MPDLEGRDPLTGATIGRYAEASPTDIRAAMARARESQAAYAAAGIPARVALLAALRKTMAGAVEEITEAVVRATGKVHVEALAGDLMVTLEMLAYCESRCPEVLAPQERPSPLLYRGCRSWVEYRPFGVVAVIAPWNFPLQLSLVPALFALAAGNAVLLKPSEVTPSVGALIQDLWSRAGGPPGLLQVLQGGPEVGRALVAEGPDKVFFTGSVATGRQVMAAAAERLIPVELELGGKDPMLVFDDAPMPRAVNAALYGAMSNAGQTCVSVERCYVQRPLYRDFCQQAAAGAQRLRLGQGVDADLGPLIRPEQVDTVMDHLDDALARGARLLTPRRVEGNRVHPMVLADVTHEMKVMRHETFGPLLPVMAFDDEQQAVALANDSRYGLNAAVFSGDAERCRRVAARLQVGNVAINDVLKNIGNPHLPFGGVKQSGMGRYHGPEGLLAFSEPVALVQSAGTADREVNWFPYGRTAIRAVEAFIAARHGGGLVDRGRQLLGALFRS